MISAIISILIYSLILTAICIYKDISKYQELSEIDVIIAGPICWILYIIIILIKKIKNHFKINLRDKKHKVYSKKEIDKTVKRIVKIFNNTLRKNYYVNDNVILVHNMSDTYMSFPYIDDIYVLTINQLAPNTAIHEIISRRYIKMCDQNGKYVFTALSKYYESAKDHDGYDFYKYRYRISDAFDSSVLILQWCC